MPTTSRDTIQDQALRDLRTVNSELQRVGLPAWLELDLPSAQLKALVALASADGVSIRGLSLALGVGEPATSQLVEQLVRRGYATRTPDPEDRRRVVVTATHVGDDLVSALLQGRRQHAERWLAAMSDAEVDALAIGLAALAREAAAEPR